MSPTAFPLQWPPGWPKTEPQRRDHAKFKTTLPFALDFLQGELRRLGAKNLILSSNYTLGAANPKDPGVVAYFSWKTEPAYDAPEIQMAIPCDRWTRIEDNVHAIAKTIEAMRGIERWGAKNMIKAMFTGFKALPAPNGRQWWDVLGVSRNESIENCNTAYRQCAAKRHPDRGGTHEGFIELNDAWEACKKEHGK